MRIKPSLDQLRRPNELSNVHVLDSVSSGDDHLYLRLA